MKKIIVCICFFILAFFNNSLHAQYLSGSYDNVNEKINRSLTFYQNQNIINSYFYLKQIFNQFVNEAKDNIAKQDAQQVKEYVDIILGLNLNNQDYKNRALAYISTTKNKPLVDKLSFALSVYTFLNREYKNAIEYTKELSYENFNQQQIIYLKFIQAYSYFEEQDFEKAFVLFDFLRQVSLNNPFFADAYYYYSYLQIKINNNLKVALNGFYLIEANPKYELICPYYIAHLLYALKYKLNTQKYLEEKLSQDKEFLYESELTRLLTKLYFENNQYAKVIRNLAHEQKRDAEENFYLGTSYFKVDSFDQAIATLTQVTNVNDTINFEINFILAQIYLNKKNIPKAYQYLFYCASNTIKSPFDDLILLMYAKTSLDLGRSNIAFQTLQKLVTTYPNSKHGVEAKQLLILTYTNTNNFKAAINLMTDVVKIYDKKVLSKIYYGRALELFHENKLDSAKYFFIKNAELQIGDLYEKKSNVILGEIEYQKENYAGAVPYFQKALSIATASPTIANIEYQLAYTHMKYQDYAQAAIYFKHVVDANENDNQSVAQKKDALLRLGDMFWMSKKYAEASDIYFRYAQDASNVNRDYAAYQYALIVGINNPNEKIKLLQNLLVAYPETNFRKIILTEIGNAQLANNEFEKAIQTFNEILGLNDAQSLRSSALLNIGLSYNNLNNDKQAIYYLQQVADNYPNTPDAEQALLLLKEIYSNKGDVETFINIAKKSGQYADDTNTDSLYFRSAEIKYREKKYNDAFALFKDYLTKFPTNNRKNEAWYYLLNISAYYKNANLAYSFLDSLLMNNQPKYTERGLVLITKMRDTTTANKPLRLRYYSLLLEQTKSEENKTMALKSIVWLNFELNDFNAAYPYLEELNKQKELTEQDLALLHYLTAKRYAKDSFYQNAISENQKIISNNNSLLSALAAYDNANFYYALKDWTLAEKQAFVVIDKHNQYDELVLKSYLLLADIYKQQKDLFNAKATLKSIIKNASIQQYQDIANTKLLEIEQSEAPIKSATPETEIKK